MSAPNLRIYRVKHAVACWALICIFFLVHNAHAQSVNAFLVAPALARNPENGLVLSLSGSWIHFRDTADQVTPNDVMSFGGFYSQNRQWGFSLPFSFYGKNRSHAITGELYAADTWFNCFGSGQGFGGETSLRYDTRMALMRIQYMRRLNKWFFYGAKWWGEHQTLRSDHSLWASLNGKQGGWLSGPAIVGAADTRNDILWTTSGSFVEVSFQRNADWTGSDYTFNRLRFDWRHFIPIGESSTWAHQLFFDHVQGDVPFYSLPGVAAARRGRGYYEGRYRDRSLVIAQTELRLRIIPRLSWSCFAHASLLGEDADDWRRNGWIAAAGTGLRYHFGQRLVNTIRFDVAVPFALDAWIFAPNQAVKFYLAIGEAF